MKYDGWRALAYVENGKCRLVSRRGNAFKRFPDLCATIAGALPGQAVIDGEIACLDSEGKPRFYELMRRKMQPTFCAFDLLWLNGRDLRALPLLERKRRLRELVLHVDHIERRAASSVHAGWPGFLWY